MQIAALEQQNRELQRFVHLIAHDLHAPVRALNCFALLLEEHCQQARDETGLVLTERLREQGQLLAALLRDLTDYIGAGERFWRPQPVHSMQALRRALADLNKLVEDCRASFHVGELPIVAADPIALRMLFRILLSNALLYRRGSHPQIRLTAVPAGQSWTFRICDDGVGIPPQYHCEVFRPFRRLHTAAEVPGNGLGLATAQRLLARLGQRIWIESNPGFGITVCFELPALEGPE